MQKVGAPSCALAPLSGRNEPSVTGPILAGQTAHCVAWAAMTLAETVEATKRTTLRNCIVVLRAYSLRDARHQAFILGASVFRCPRL